MAKATFYQGEARSIPLRVKDKRTGAWLDLTGATCLLVVKRSVDDVDPVFTKLDADFDKTGAASGYLSVFLTTSDTWQEPWTYASELRIVRTGAPAPVGKLRFDLEIEPAISPSDFTISPVGIASQEAVGAPTIIQL
jgi:hypothetical protein